MVKVDNNNIFGSRAETYFQNGASREMLELVYKQDGHKGVKALINTAQVSKQPQPTPPAPKQHSYHDSFELSQPADGHVNFAKMAALVAGSKMA